MPVFNEVAAARSADRNKTLLFRSAAGRAGLLISQAPGNRGLLRKVNYLNRAEFVVVGWIEPQRDH